MKLGGQCSVKERVLKEVNESRRKGSVICARRQFRQAEGREEIVESGMHFKAEKAAVAGISLYPLARDDEF